MIRSGYADQVSRLFDTTPKSPDVTFHERLRDCEPIVGGWVSLTDPAVAEIVAGSGVDFVMLDTEHAPTGLETVANHARAVDAADGEAVPLARVPWNDPVAIKRILDVGVGGVMVPMVDSAKAAREAVAATYYPPEGVRGIATGRASGYGRRLGEYVASANEEVLTVVQVESEDGLDNVRAIADVEGVDALFVGPADLSAALGRFGEWNHPAFVEAVERVVEAGDETGTPVGTIGARPDQIRVLGDLGFDFMVAGVDSTHLIEGQCRAIEAFQGAVGGE